MPSLFLYAAAATVRIIYEIYKSIYFWYNIRNRYIIHGISKNISLDVGILYRNKATATDRKNKKS